jgi:hypothetical protein
VHGAQLIDGCERVGRVKDGGGQLLTVKNEKRYEDVVVGHFWEGLETNTPAHRR